MNGENAPGIVARAMLILIRAYQLTLSGLVGRYCRHLPTCSQYAADAISRHGAWAGFWLAFFRVLRCHPWGSAGFDPVPERIDRLSLNIGIYRRVGRNDHGAAPSS